MATVALTAPVQPATDEAVIVRAVTVVIGTVVGLSFTFGFGDVLTLALRLGVPVWVAPLVAPAVDLSILGLLLGTRHLALQGATTAELRPARRLLIFASLATLALNSADPIITGAYGKAAFDAVGSHLLIGWAEVGPGLLQAIAAVGISVTKAVDVHGTTSLGCKKGTNALGVLADGKTNHQDGVTEGPGVPRPPKTPRSMAANLSGSGMADEDLACVFHAV